MDASGQHYFRALARYGGWWAHVLPCLLLLAHPAAATSPETDSLRRRLRVETTDTTRVLLLKDISFDYRTSRPDSALYFARTGLELARRIGYRRGEALCLNSQGGAYLSIGNLPRALQAFLDALQINEQRQSRRGVAGNLGNIGRVYAGQGDYRAAIRYAFRSKALFEAVRSPDDATLQLLNIGGSYVELERLDSALLYTRQGYQRARREHNDRNLVIALTNLGVLYGKVPRYDLALRSYRQAIPYCLRIGQTEFLCTNYLNIAEVFGKLHQPDSLLYYGRRSLALARQSGLNGPILDASILLNEHFDQHHRPDSAYRYLKLAVAARDSVYNEERIQRVQQMTFAESVRQQELRAAQEQVQQTRRYNLQVLGIAVFILTFLALLVPLSRRLAHTRAVEVLGLVALLMLFEFVTLLTEPTINRLTNSNPVLLLLSMMTLAAALAPLHHRLERWVRQRLLRRAARERSGPEAPVERDAPPR